MRIVGIHIPDKKRIEIALTYIYGIGLASSRNILAAVGIDPNRRAKDLTSDEIGKLQSYIEKHYHVDGHLRQTVRRNIQRLMQIQSYRGSRHARRLPVRGQRTRTNSRTVRGNVRRTAGSGKRKLELK
ncbi:30S ribosomal protein S13 [Candidatus Parcubacteria bacterium]|nr:MAG: 30S ribosomal protein S13 [Candidatus Parcubacteria bacterium]